MNDLPQILIMTQLLKIPYFTWRPIKYSYFPKKLFHASKIDLNMQAPKLSQPKIAFISGPLESDTDYFNTHYLPLLRHAVEEDHHFIVGPSRGIDTQTRRYLLHEARILPTRITVFLNVTEASRLRPEFKSFEASGGKVVVAGRNHTARDVAMTRASHYDILRCRTEAKCRALYGDTYRKRVSGTEKNELRRQQGIGMAWSG
ncbi:hypothetical protein IW261DRAFT_106805 [Armillaria novae-zelandiae]|uniref:Uncharacterized protein n=1 Tax=Armillaria novae-zelandiae TaxID=153914 RepID=A0AA39P9D8_9AGAR|nr:hypothetical protein IW261DRAFT_106805 [Armillaria novae-zelandiae]